MTFACARSSLREDVVGRGYATRDVLASCNKLRHASFYGMGLVWLAACGVQRVVANVEAPCH